MNKAEFLNTLKDKLMEDLSAAQANEHVRYYEEYINQQVQEGRFDETVLTELGDPILIARTILDASQSSGSNAYYSESADNERSEQEKKPGNNKIFRTDTNWGCIITAVVMVLVILLILRVVGAVVSAVLPILVPVVLVLFILTLIKQRR